MRIAAFSDTHGHHEQVVLPPADVLIFAGDFMTTGYSFQELNNFGRWFSRQPHKHKVWIAGNHDRAMENYPGAPGYAPGCTYLHNSGVTIDGVTFWGSPYTPWFNDWAFSDPRPDSQEDKDDHYRARRRWQFIPTGTDVLVTHGPPMGQMDSCYDFRLKKTIHVGCPELQVAVHRVKPKVHIFGHIHAGYGSDIVGRTRSYNVSICNEAYAATNEVTVIDL